MEVMEKTAEAVMGDAAQAGAMDAGNDDGGSATTLEELVEQQEPGVSEQAETPEEEEAAESESAEEEDSEEESEEPAEQEDEEGQNLSDEERKGLSQKAQERIEHKIRKAHAKQHEAEEAAEAARAEVEQLQAQVQELQQSLDSVDLNQAAQQAGVSELYMLDSAEALDAKLSEMTDGAMLLQDWLDDHERDETMVVGEAEYTYQQVRQRMRELKRSVELEGPKARKVLERRSGAEADARRLYPDLFKATSAQHQEMQRLLRTVPGLRALPDAKLLIGRMLAGKALEGKPAAKTTTKKAEKPTAPKPPDRAKPAARSAGSESKHDPKKVAESGSWDDLL